MVGHFNFGKQQLYFTKFYHISPCMTLRETFLGTSLQAVNGNSLTNCHQKVGAQIVKDAIKDRTAPFGSH
jgi:hypothetical protein